MDDRDERSLRTHVRLLGVGLRPRLLAALLLTSAVTLAVAALALLSPLQSRLRQDATSSILTAALGARAELQDAVTPTDAPDLTEIGSLSRALGRRLGSRVALVDSSGQRLFDTDPDIVDRFDDAARVFATQHTVHDVAFGKLRAAIPVHIGRHLFALVLRKRLDDVSAANRVVSNAFLKAAGVGLVIALLLGIGLATTLLRRLERLRDAAREMETGGLDAPSPVDHSRDEIGELARTFAAMQSRLRRQEAARRAFVATASHELRTPLASLDGMLELLGDDLAEPLDLDDAHQRLVQAQAQSRRLGQLASDLLDLSRIDAAVELRSEGVELVELSRAVLAEFERRADDRDCELVFEAPDSPAWATGDPGSLARIVRILLDNALRLSPAGETVEVGVRNRSGSVEVSVSDRGPGVPLEDREIIFERFQRGTAATGEGFGLGLAIGRELAVRMHGSLSTEDSAVGARFVLRVPDNPAAAREATEEPVPVEAVTGRMP
jgi:signal transduction histidine kinase